MLRKFLASLVVTVLFASTTASALDVSISDGPVGGITSYINNFSVSPSQINPSQDEVAAINFDLAANMYLYAYAMNSSTYAIYPILGEADSPVNRSAGNVTLNWYATVDNSSNGSSVPAGNYTVKVFSSNSQGNVTDFDYTTVTVESGSDDNNGGNDDNNDGNDDNNGNNDDNPPVVVIGGGDDDSNDDAPKVTGININAEKIDVSDNEDLSVSFTIDEEAEVTVVIKDEDGNVVRTFPAYNGDVYDESDNPLEITWDGRDDDGDYVASGTYTVEITTESTSGSSDNTVDFEVEVDNSSAIDSGVIDDFTVSPTSDWDPTDEELEIEFELTEEVDELEVYAKKGSKTVEIEDDTNADDDDYEFEWDGTDDDGDYVDAGDWQIWVKADGDQVYKTVEVAYEEATIEEAFVTKEEFDNEEGEFTTLLFKLDEDALVTIDLYDSNSKEDELMDEEELEGDVWYAVTWYGTDEDGDEVDYDEDYEFRITVQNEASEEVTDTETVSVEVEEDDVSSSKSNITNDYVSPVVYEERSDELIEIHYCIDESAEVTVEIFEGKNASGSSEVELIEDYDQGAGCHTIEWDVTDEDGDDLKDGIYSYEITTEIGSKKDTEEGRFVVGDQAHGDDDHGLYGGPYYGSGLCGAYWDAQIYSGTEMCDALDWVTVNGIFEGYDDGSIGVNKYINRAETFKVVLKTFGVAILPADGSTLGFNDVDPYAWYMPYVRTAMFHGMLEGYNNGTEARLGNNINRAEILKFVLEGSRAFSGYTIPGYSTQVYMDVDPYGVTSWVQPYAGVSSSYGLFDEVTTATGLYLNPGDLVTRGEVALLLYRMYKGGLL